MSGDADEDDDGLLGNPERFEPSLGPDVPEVDVPSVPDPAESTDVDVDPELRATFWRLVLVFDVAFLAMAVGPMFVFFRGDWATGGPMFVLGVLAFAYGVSQYRQYRDRPE
ncbi:DUF7322 domain-containing protein [Halosimplex amylolyticum]|uniref:DUF7322 domain-containing protein n=1 Tax=Halosimplex amylolyticum TaxID=3396616 RepID=UPI003F56F077